MSRRFAVALSWLASGCGAAPAPEAECTRYYDAIAACWTEAGLEYASDRDTFCADFALVDDASRSEREAAELQLACVADAWELAECSITMTGFLRTENVTTDQCPSEPFEL